MTDDEVQGGGSGEPQPRPAANPVPFVVALVGFLVVAVLAFVLLREEDEGALVRPERFERLDERTVRTRPEIPAVNVCTVVERAQVDFDDERVYLELVVDVPECEDGHVPIDVVADIELPEPIGDRQLVGGVGRQHLPCEPNGGEGRFTCGPDR